MLILDVAAGSDRLHNLCLRTFGLCVGTEQRQGCGCGVPMLFLMLCDLSCLRGGVYLVSGPSLGWLVSVMAVFTVRGKE